ncbi:MAG: glycosyltransferase family 2 protein [Bacteroidota bacterium]
MKISIITATFNSAATLKDTIESVVSQDYPSFEYIVKDGQSVDGTIEIVRSFGDAASKFVSKKDAGIYDALNQGLEMATGDVIGFLHSDDVYTGSSVLSKIAKQFEAKKCDAVYSDLYYVSRDNTDNIIRKWKSGNYKDGMFLNGWMPPHPTFFVRREIYEQFGNFNTDLKSAADYELMLRFIHKNKIRISYLEEFTVKMRTGGQSNISLSNRYLANMEDRRAWQLNGLKPRFYTLTWKPIRKIFQYL